MDTIECKLCGKNFKMLDKHLYFKHNTSVTAYKIRYPEAPIVSQSVLEKRNKLVSDGVLRWWKNVSQDVKNAWSNKRKQGCFNKYGVTHISYVREARRKAEITLKERYGDDCYLKMWNKGQAQRKKTMIAKYGFVNPMDNEVLAEKAIRTHIFPTSPEKLLMREFKDSVIYTGNGKVWIKFNDGKRKNPDLVVINNPYKVIEVHGDRWHIGENAEDLRKKYSDVGFDCFVVWEHELKNSSTRFETLNKLKEFIFESSTTVRQTSNKEYEMKIQSVLTGNSKSVAEMTTPSLCEKVT